MNDRVIMSWTVLIYADGNNEMEEIVYRTIENCRNIGVLKDINVVIEIGLLGMDKSTENKWSGVRRYYMDFREPIIIEELGRANMADPNSLYKFIEWGIKSYPAKHYMVVLSGHGADFVGGLTDTSLESNYIMGISEMSRAVGLGTKAANSIIDILVLDMCFMNSIEVLYEFAQQEDTVKRVIVYTDYAPYEGLDYNKLIKLIEINANETDINLFMKSLIDNLDFQLTAYGLDKKCWGSVKNVLSDLAHVILKYRDSDEKSLAGFMNENNKQLYSSTIRKINDELQAIVIYSNTEFLGINSSIKIKCEDISNLMHFYNKLAFSKDNYWRCLLSNVTCDKEMKKPDKVKVRTVNAPTPTIHYILELNITR